VNQEALHTPVRLARVLAAMGFDLHLGETTRGAIVWWPPEYRRRTPWRARLGQSGSVVARGYREGSWAPDAAAIWDTWEATDRALVAEVNRGIRDTAVQILAASRPGQLSHDVYAVDTRSGESRNASGVQFGHDLLSLGALRWGCRYGQAGARIARVAGFRVPTVPETRSHAAA